MSFQLPFNPKVMSRCLSMPDATSLHRDSNLGSVLSVYFCHYFSIFMAISVFSQKVGGGQRPLFFYVQDVSGFHLQTSSPYQFLASI